MRSSDIKPQPVAETTPTLPTLDTAATAKKKVKVVDLKDEESSCSNDSTKPIIGEDLESLSSPVRPESTKPQNEQASSPAAKKVSKKPANRRHHADFNKQKSSDAMKLLLNADEQYLKKQKIITGMQVVSKTAVEKPPAGVSRENSRSESRGRASSKWRKGTTQTSLEREMEESARKIMEMKKKQMEYPTWWSSEVDDHTHRVKFSQF